MKPLHIFWGFLCLSIQEQIVLERSARLNLDPGRGDEGDGGDRRSFVRGQSLEMIICKRPYPTNDHLQVAGSST